MTKREKIIIRTSVISIASNLVLVSFKATVGLLSNSIAIISDAINNLSDALSGIITIIGTKLATKAPDREHPHGHGRIEYITSLIVSAIVLYAGLTALIESVEKIIRPEPVDYTSITLLVLIAAIVIKFILGLYVKRKGRTANSDSLIASGTDALNDAIISISVLTSAIIYLVFGINIEAYVGVIISLLIIKAGVELIKTSVDSVLGTRVNSNLARKIKQEITKEKFVQGAFDLDLHDYGPDRYFGSVHIELPDTLTVTEVDKISRRITKNVLDRYGVLLHTIGVYSINTKDADIIQAKTEISKIVFAHSGILEMHGFYLDKSEKVISLDIIVDFKQPDREKILRAIHDQIQSSFPHYKINITLDLDVSD